MTAVDLIYNDLANFFKKQQDVQIPSTSVDLIESGYLDSLLFVELLVFIEQKYGFEVSIEDIELDDFRSLSSIAHYIQARNGVVIPESAK